jgi:AcrR family transcriptional regulator
VAKRGSYAKTGIRKQQIAGAALELIVERGHRSFTMADVARRAGISEQLVFYHFPTREVLLVAALQYFDDQELGREVPPGALSKMAENARLGVRRENIVRLYAELSGASVDPAHPAHEYFQKRWARSRRGLTLDIQRLQSSGAIVESIDAYSVSRILLGAWEGLQLQWLHDPSFDIGEQLIRLADAMLLGSVEDAINYDEHDWTSRDGFDVSGV